MGKRRSVVRHVFALLALGALCACGTDDSMGSTGSPGSMRSTGSTGEPEVTAPESRAQTAPATDEVLSVDDLPEGWTEVPDVNSDSGGDSCLDALASSGGPFDSALAESVTFAGGEIGPFLTATVVEQPAEQVLPAVDDVLVACDGQTSAGGFETSVEGVAIDGLPPSSLAVRGSDTTVDGSGVRFVVAAAGTEAATLMVIAITPLGDVDEALVAQAVVAAYDRLPTA